MTDDSPPVVLVTGSSSGIGLATSVAAAEAGLVTVAGLRDLSRAAAIERAAADAGLEIDLVQLDVTDPGSVATCVEGVVERHGRLDALVNNAGAAHVGTIELDSMAAIRAVLEVNFFGVVAMTQAAMPHLRARAGRVITVSSVGGIVGQPFNEAYCAAKFAVEGFMEGLAPVARSVGVSVCVVEPGAVASSFVANAGVDAEAMIRAAGPYAPALRGYLTRTAGAFEGAQDPREVGRQIVELLRGVDVPFRSQTTAQAQAFVGAKLADLDGSAIQGLTRTWVTGP
jgi:NAD(P)-dependent dehydrogenase (short-subunit alcohol dehydrogenase family)